MYINVLAEIEVQGCVCVRVCVHTHMCPHTFGQVWKWKGAL